jgi:wyosine [tRNA(Phe)-imidazoG37] synthetase (radical SAM superfamily)
LVENNEQPIQRSCSKKKINHTTTIHNNMATIIFPSPIFGPIKSRRLGISLGINLLPDDGKVCTFDCLYCECGFNATHRTKKQLPTRKEVAEALEAKLQCMVENNEYPDVLTFAGNGEPTIHPFFADIIDDTIALRNKYCPNAKISVLSNATQITKDKVFDALKKVDNNILKLDSAIASSFRLINQPTSNGVLPEGVIADLKRFNGKCIVQTMFLRGEHNGKHIDNGQFADFDHFKTYDTLDLASALKKGKNTLAILVWYCGVETFRFSKDDAGLIFEVTNASGDVLAASGKNTLARQSLG